MAEKVLIPKLGNTVEDVTIVEWLVEDGARVSKGQEVLEIETDKATFTVESPADGYIHVGPFESGDVVPVFTLVAVVGAEDDVFPETGEGGREPEERAVELSFEGEERESEPEVPEEERIRISPRARRLAEEKGVDVTELTPTGPGRRIIERDVLDYLERRPRITPVARRMAEEAGLDIGQLVGSGIGGRITKKDVEMALEAAQAVPEVSGSKIEVPAGTSAAEGEDVLRREPLKGVRKIIAERMGLSVNTTARVTLVMEVDATEFVAMRNRLKEQVTEEWGFAPGYNDLLVFVVSRVLRQFPYMNARLTADAIEYMAHVNVGIAVDTERGLVVPNIKDADRKSLRDIGRELRDLAQQARSGRISPDHLKGGTFTITSLGAFDVEAFTPVINLPEAAILGVGRIAPKPVVRGGEIVPRQMMTLSLVFDHRLVDGVPAARFERAVKRYIEDPYLLFTVVK